MCPCTNGVRSVRFRSIFVDMEVESVEVHCIWTDMSPSLDVFYRKRICSIKSDPVREQAEGRMDLGGRARDDTEWIEIREGGEREGEKKDKSVHHARRR